MIIAIAIVPALSLASSLALTLGLGDILNVVAPEVSNKADKPDSRHSSRTTRQSGMQTTIDNAICTVAISAWIMLVAEHTVVSRKACSLVQSTRLNRYPSDYINDASRPIPHAIMAYTCGNRPHRRNMHSRRYRPLDHRAVITECHGSRHSQDVHVWQEARRTPPSGVGAHVPSVVSC